MKKIFAQLWSHTLGGLLHHLRFRLNYFLRFREYEYVYHLLCDELKSDPNHQLPEYERIRQIIGTGGTELFGCHGITDKEAAKKYERVFKKHGIVCSYDTDVSRVYQLFKAEYLQ